jgi:hypothetical protein
MEQRNSISLGAQVCVYGCCCLAALGNGPNDEGLSSAHISGGKDAIDRAHKVGSRDVAAVIQG